MESKPALKQLATKRRGKKKKSFRGNRYTVPQNGGENPAGQDSEQTELGENPDSERTELDENPDGEQPKLSKNPDDRCHNVYLSWIVEREQHHRYANIRSIVAFHEIGIGIQHIETFNRIMNMSPP